MPHIDIKCFPRELTDEQKQALATDICHVFKQHFGSTDESLSVALTMVEKDKWQAEVWDKQIGPNLESLVKKPGTRL